MDGFEIRAAVPSDADVVADYHEACFRKTYSAQLAEGVLRVPDWAGTRDQLRGWFADGSGFPTSVLVDGESPIGHLTVHGNLLCHLFVAPDFQGRGLGKYLLQMGEDLIASDGHTEFELHARIDNVNAIAFYERFGWTVSGRTMHTVEHGVSYDEHILVKPAPA